MPSKETIQGWYRAVDCQSGHCNDAYNQLKNIAENCEKVYVSLMLDDAAIRQHTQYFPQEKTMSARHLTKKKKTVQKLRYSYDADFAVAIVIAAIHLAENSEVVQLRGGITKRTDFSQSLKPPFLKRIEIG